MKIDAIYQVYCRDSFSYRLGPASLIRDVEGKSYWSLDGCSKTGIRGTLYISNVPYTEEFVRKLCPRYLGIVELEKCEDYVYEMEGLLLQRRGVPLREEHLQWR